MTHTQFNSENFSSTSLADSNDMFPHSVGQFGAEKSLTTFLNERSLLTHGSYPEFSFGFVF